MKFCKSPQKFILLFYCSPSHTWVCFVCCSNTRPPHRERSLSMNEFIIIVHVVNIFQFSRLVVDYWWLRCNIARVNPLSPSKGLEFDKRFRKPFVCHVQSSTKSKINIQLPVTRIAVGTYISWKGVPGRTGVRPAPRFSSHAGCSTGSKPLNSLDMG